MKIGINALFLVPGEVGGSQTYLVETLRAMLRHFPEHEYTLFTHEDNDNYLRRKLSGMGRTPDYVCLPFQGSNRYVRIIREQTQLAWKVRSSGCDILWSPGYTACLGSPIPQVVSVLDMQYKRYPEDLSPIARWVTACLIPLGVRRCAGVIALSEFSKREIIQFTGIPEERVRVTHLGCDSSWFEPVPWDDRDVLVKQWGLLSKLYLLCVANTYPHKNVPLVIEAYKRVREQNANLALVLVGKPRRGEARVRKTMQGVPKVLRAEDLPLRQLQMFLQNSAAFVFPSLYEGFGLPVLEAMASGVPVIASRCGAIPEVAGESAEYVSGTSADELALAIQRVLNWDPRQREQRCAEARERARRFGWAKTAENTLNVFDHVRSQKF